MFWRPESIPSALTFTAHLDQRRPGAFEAFADEVLRRANAEFAAACDFTGGVKDVGRGGEAKPSFPLFGVYLRQRDAHEA